MQDIDFLMGEFWSKLGNCSKHFAKISEDEFNILLATASLNCFWLSLDYNFSINALKKLANSFENLSTIWSISENSENLDLIYGSILGKLSNSWVISFLLGLWKYLLISCSIFKSVELIEDVDTFLLSLNVASPFAFSIDFSDNYLPELLIRLLDVLSR